MESVRIKRFISPNGKIAYKGEHGRKDNKKMGLEIRDDSCKKQKLNVELMENRDNRGWDNIQYKGGQSQNRL